MFKKFFNFRPMDAALDDGTPAGSAANADSGAAAGDAGDASKGTPAEGDKGASKLSEKEHQLLQEVMEKKAKLLAEKSAREAAEAKLKQFEGINLDEVKTLLSKKQEDEHKALEAKGEFEKVKQQMREAHQNEVKTLSEQIKAIQDQLSARESVIDELSIGHAFTGSRFIQEKLVLPPSKARTVFGTHFERNEHGVIVGYDKPKGTSNRAPLVDSNGDPLPFDEAISKLVERDPDKDLILRASVKAGAGSSTSTTTGGGGSTPEVTGQSRISLALSQGALKKTALNLKK